ncbi:MAG: hypothetical protein A2Z77_05415 [Chloroflexi bacterium RBG_13_51_36]|nr:MAG: hypothetical protein A2Z77_05415 [Chloroflexi bacterium RBG_13_51_36]
MTVSLVRFDGSLDSLRKAIDLCAGFEKLDKDDRVLIKPNNCFRHRIMPPYGMVTTSWIMNAVVRLLLEHGCKNISIGEGAIIGIFDELAPETKRGFKGTGMERMAKKYGIKLIDFNEGAFEELDLGGTKVQVSRAALETDFLVNVPVLKTHFQARVSLGFKNMKGCLNKASKKRFHSSKRLDTLICLLNEAIKSDLVIIDGIYMLEKGPETLAGVAHRKDLIIASRDIFECDVVGATVMGIDPSHVDYLREFAQRHNRSFDISAIEIKGQDMEVLKERLEWRFEPDKELLGPSNVTGLSAPYPGQTLCSACGATLALALSIFGKDNPGMDFGGVAFYYGLGLKPERDSQAVLLYGDCAIRSNKGLQNAIKIEGCPPTLTKTLLALMKALLSKPRMFKMLLLRTTKLIGIRLGVYREVFPGWERYRTREFDRTHF